MAGSSMPTSRVLPDHFMPGMTAQGDLNLRKVHMSEGIFSDIAS